MATTCLNLNKIKKKYDRESAAYENSIWPPMNHQLRYRKSEKNVTGPCPRDFIFQIKMTEYKKLASSHNSCFKDVKI